MNYPGINGEEELFQSKIICEKMKYKKNLFIIQETDRLVQAHHNKVSITVLYSE